MTTKVFLVECVSGVFGFVFVVELHKGVGSLLEGRGSGDKGIGKDGGGHTREDYLNVG